MKHKNLALTLGAIFTSTIILLFSCRKINESTTLGGDLIPPVDNIHTFDTLLDVEAYNDTFSVTTDSTIYNSSYEHFLGHIETDPFFGKTDAQLYLQLKPSTFRFTFINRPDSLNIDSVVLVLDYKETYGDSTAPQTVNVYEVAQGSDFRADTSYRLRQAPLAKAGLLGSRTFQPRALDDSVKAFKDTTSHQLRIRLDDSFGDRLLKYDTSVATGAINGAFLSDSAFNTKFKGFALESTGGNAVMGFDLTGANTKLAIYYKDDNNNAPVNKWDTVVSYFSFVSPTGFTTNKGSASAQFVQRDYNGTPLAAAAGGLLPDPLVYIQATPGSYAKVKIPGLAALPNCIVHRAELITEEAFDLSDSLFPASYLFLDAYDPTVANRFNTIPYDFLFDATGGNNLGSFGVSAVNKSDGLGHNVKAWHFNISRYVQNVVNDVQPVYDLRLFAPFYVYDYYKPYPSFPEAVTFVAINSAAVRGRTRLYGGDATRTNPQRMRLRIVYSKI